LKKIFFLILLFDFYSYASLIGSHFSQRDLRVLEDLDLSPSFINDYKLQEIYEKSLNKRNSSNYVEKLNDASLFLPKLKSILKQEGIPDIFIYMAMAESDFKLDAKSGARAVGLWQFMGATGRRYGLKNNLYIDERMDLVKSTYAAAKYLKGLHKVFGKWYLAALAYNCGAARVYEALTRATIDMYVKKNPKLRKSKKIRNFRKIIKDYQQKRVKFSKLKNVYKETLKWNITPSANILLREQKVVSRQYLPKESRVYIRKIVSLAMMKSESFIADNQNSYLLNLGMSATIATVKVKGGLHLKNIAQAIGMSYDELHKLNKHIKQSIIPPSQKFYTINIPYSTLSRFNENKDGIKDNKFAIYVVKKGDTLYGISKKYKVPYKLIRDYNKLKTNRLSLKQKITLPIPANIIGKTRVPNKIKGIYIVKNGDSLYSIAKRFRTRVKKLISDNKLNSNLLKIGDKLVVR